MSNLAPFAAITLSNGNLIGGGGTSPAGGSITSATGNILLGSRAGAFITTSPNNVILGLDAGLLLTTAQGQEPQPNVYVGYRAGSHSSGGGNVAIGYIAGGADALSTKDVYSMTAVGELALNKVTDSQKDTAVGSFALENYLRGGQMTAIGRGAASFVIEGSYSLFAGHGTAIFNVSSVENIAIGNGAGNALFSGIPPRITASVTAGVMNVTAFTLNDSPIAVGMVFVSTTGTGFTTNYTIASFGTGTGGIGTYNVLPNNQNALSQTMQGGIANSGNIYIGQTNGTAGYTDINNIIIGNNVVAKSASGITAIGGGQTAAYISGNLSWRSDVAAVASAAGVTLTAAQMRGGLIVRSAAIAVSDTLPTAAQIVAAIPACEIGSTIWFDIVNNNTGLLTIAAPDASVSLSGTTTIATLFTRSYCARVTIAASGSEAVTLYGISTAAN